MRTVLLTARLLTMLSCRSAIEELPVMPIDITVWEERTNYSYSKQKLELSVEITNLLLRNAQTGHSTVMTMLELTSRNKSIAKIVNFKSAFSPMEFMRTA